MRAPTCRWILLLVLSSLAASASAEQLSREEVAQRGKAATAYIESPPRSGTAFCINPAGFFVTNAHVVRAALGRPVTLVVPSSESGTRKLQGKIVRKDEQLDLAVLRVEDSKPFVSLPLGSADHLSELMEVITFGFPFGRALGGRGQTAPAVTVNVHNITSLRKEDGVLQRIQLDSGLNPGNSGSPVVDRDGKVVGIVQGGIQGGANLNMAIPVNQLRRFLLQPDIEFVPPTLAQRDLTRPVSFRATVRTLLPSEEHFRVELALRAGDGPERRVEMLPEKGGYSASAVPAPVTASPGRFHLTALYGNDTVSGWAAERSFVVGNRTIAFSQVREVHLEKPARVHLQAGDSVEGSLSGLEDVPVRVGETELRLDLGKASEIRFDAPDSGNVVCAVIALAGDKEVGRVSQPLLVRDAAQTLSGPAPALTTQPTTKPLPAPVTNVVVGGNGQYLVLYLPKVGQLGVFDASRNEIRYLPVADDNIKFAAGMDKLVVVLPTQRIIQRWNLATLKRELSVPLPEKLDIKALALGCASSGPLLAYTASAAPQNPAFSRGGFATISLQTLKPMEVDMNQQNMMSMMLFPAGEGVRLRAAADGTAFGAWRTSVSPAGLAVLNYAGNEIKGRYEHTSTHYVVPGADGKLLYTGIGRFSADLKSLEEPGHAVAMVPAFGGEYYLSIKFPQGEGPVVWNQQPTEQNVTVGFHLVGEGRTLATLSDISLVPPQPYSRQDLSFDQRLFFLPAAKMLVCIPQSDDRLLLRRFDIETAMERSGIDYLFVTSQPPTRAFKGSNFHYQIKTKSRKGGLKYALESAPPGMTISETGNVSWAVPQDATEEEVTVIVSIRAASGQERFHTFRLTVRD